MPDIEGRSVKCETCDKYKAPIGRSVAIAMAGSYCDDECTGYRDEPHPGWLFPGELWSDTFGDMTDIPVPKPSACYKSHTSTEE